MRRSLNQTSGITLVETLVVMAVIAVLAALMLPALRQSRETAKKALCLSNLRQVGMAIITYSGDNSDFLPHTVRGVCCEDGQETGTWADRLGGTTRKCPSGYVRNPVCLPYDPSAYGPRYKRTVWTCPFADEEVPSPHPTNSNWTCHYGLNTYVLGVYSNELRCFTTGPFKLKNLRTDLMLLADASVVNGTNDCFSFSGKNFGDGCLVAGGKDQPPWPVDYCAKTKIGPWNSSRAIPPHGNVFSAFYVDGHAEQLVTLPKHQIQP